MSAKPPRTLERVTDQFDHYHERLRDIRQQEGRPGLDPIAEAIARAAEKRGEAA
jgi:hypothetical protein